MMPPTGPPVARSRSTGSRSTGSRSSDRGATVAAPDDDAVWRALADPRRRAMLDLLAAGPATTGELVERFDELCRTAVMKHLDVLVEARLVIARREGRRRWNHLNPVPIQRLHERWVSRHVRRTAASLLRLEDHVERGRPPRRRR